MTDDRTCDQQIITSIADAVVKLKELKESNKNLNDSDIEERFARLSLAFKTDKFTLSKRLDLQLRQRDIAEKNIESELKALRESLNALNQLCTDSDMREVITKTQQHVDIVQQATMRMSSRAESYGAIQQEQRMNCAFETMLNYVEHLKLLYDKEHIELEEYRRMLAEHNLLPDEKSSPDGPDDSKRILPPRSHSLSSSSRPEFIRRGSLSTFIRPPHADSHKVISRENSAGHLSVAGLNMGVVRQKLETRTRLLSAVCLLNNNFDSTRVTSSGVNTPSNSPLSANNRRSSLPVGPVTNYYQPTFTASLPSISNRSHGSINERLETPKEEKKSSQEKTAIESRLTRTDSPEPDNQNQEAKHNKLQDSATCHGRTEDTSDKDSSNIIIPDTCTSDMDQNDTSKFPCLLQESPCENETDEDVCLLPEIIIPVTSKPLYLFKLLRWASEQGIWHWDSATLMLNARYAVSALLATAAMCSLVLTFMPNQVTAYVMSPTDKKM